MSQYQVSTKSPYRRNFWVLSGIVITFFLAISFVAAGDIGDLSDVVRKALGIGALAVVFVSILGAAFFASLESTWNYKRSLSFEIRNERIFKSRDGIVVVDLPLADVESAILTTHWLILRGSKV